MENKTFVVVITEVISEEQCNKVMENICEKQENIEEMLGVKLASAEQRSFKI